MKRITLAILTACAVSTGVHAQSNCAGDISGDGQVNGVDLALVLTSWGVCQANPAIGGVYPPTGPAAGGTPIAIVGVDLGRTASVTIDGVIAPQFSVVSGTTVTAVTPAGSAGARAIVLRDAQGQQIAAANYSYFVSELPWATVLEQYPSPSVVTNATLRESLRATGLPWRVRDNASGIEMVLVSPGTFEMGCTASLGWPCFAGESPVHAVTLTRPFYLGRYEVTQAQWSAAIGSNPSEFQYPTAQVPAAQVPNRPVELVSWNMIQSFLAVTGTRLPTEAEWEYAYRAGTTTAFHGSPIFPNGTDDDALVGVIGWFGPESQFQTHPVGTKAGNGFGLHDMAGNVWEWVGDWYSGSYYASSPTTDPPGPESGGRRVLRGGSRDDRVPANLRASLRIDPWPWMTGSNTGFRVARNP